MAFEGTAPRLAIDYVTPLPPVRSGIADYSVDLLPHLEPHLDLRVFRPDDQPVAEEVERRFRTRPASDCGAEGRLPLYQMGNNPYHDQIYSLALERPGLLTLHDLVLHHLLTHRTLGQGDYDGYLEGMAADHGWIGEATCRLRYWSTEDVASLFALPAHRRLLRRQRGILVHSRWAAEKIREDDPEIAVRPVPMAVPLPEIPPAEAGAELRARHGIPTDAPLLGSFGFQTPIKRTSSVIAALCRPRLQEAHLLVAGEASPGLDLAAEAAAAGVRERVHVVGFLPYGELESAIAAVDLCLNLRYPTAGETSASLLRVLAMGCPAVVSDYAQFAELPQEVALRVRLGEEEGASLEARVGDLLEEPEALARMGRAARRHVREHHDPAACGRAVAEACRKLAEEKPPGDRPYAAPPATSLTASELPAKIELSGAEAPWPAGERRRLKALLTNDGSRRWLATHHGPGGVALEIAWSGSRPQPPIPWIPLPRDVAPGETVTLELMLRRPQGDARLSLAPRVLGGPDVRTPRLEVAL